MPKAVRSLRVKDPVIGQLLANASPESDLHAETRSIGCVSSQGARAPNDAGIALNGYGDQSALLFWNLHLPHCAMSHDDISG